MCFSPESSFISGAVVGGIGIATLTKIRSWREVLLGLLPLMFGIHQVLEGLIWLGLEGRVSPRVERGSVILYILFAHALLPAIIPWSIWLPEPDPKRRQLLAILVLLGTFVAGLALWELAGAEIDVAIRHHGIEYDDPLTGPWWFATLYIILTCVPPFLSSYPWMFAFATLDAIALIVIMLIKMLYLTSIWCALAALISVLVYLHFRRVRQLAAQPAG